MHPKEGPLRVHLLSPHPFVLAELAGASSRQGLTVVPIRLAYSLAASLPQFEAEHGSVCVLDACFPPATNDALVSEVVAAHLGIRVIVVMETLTAEQAVPLLRRGVKGILTCAEAKQQLLAAITAVAKGGLWVPREVLSTFLDGLLGDASQATPLDPRVAGLSRREMDVLDALLRNQSNKEIAARLGISERTVKFHVSNLLTKFSVQRRADLIFLSLQPPSLPG
jgi:DNA-binding NarL/FixJ family response regulator